LDVERLVIANREGLREGGEQQRDCIFVLRIDYFGPGVTVDLVLVLIAARLECANCNPESPLLHGGFTKVPDESLF
jgi:hypothetical protein